MSALLADAGENAVETASYLLAYDFVLLLAPLAHLALLALAPRERGWLGDGRGPFAAFVLGLTEPLSRSSFERNLGRLGTPGAVAAYLGVSHALNAYAWVLLGPLLGKDFLLSHVVGVTLFVLFAAGLMRAVGVPLEAEAAVRPPRRAVTTLARAVLRFVCLAGGGLLLGGLVAAWGFSPRAWALVDLGGGGFSTQLANGAIGLGLALVGVPPLANLFVGTYLWKVGLAHAGIVAYLCASTAAPTRWRLYARLYGRGSRLRLVTVLLLAALLSGLVTAFVFGALGLSIRYKLLPAQLWEISRSGGAHLR